MHVRVTGRRQGIVCGLDEMNLVTIARSLWWVPLQGLITKLRHPPTRILASDIHGLCLSCCGVTSIPPLTLAHVLWVHSNDQESK